MLTSPPRIPTVFLARLEQTLKNLIPFGGLSWFKINTNGIFHGGQCRARSASTRLPCVPPAQLSLIPGPQLAEIITFPWALSVARAASNMHFRTSGFRSLRASGTKN